MEGIEVYYCKWTVEQLKDFLRHQQIPLTGNKAELAEKVYDIVQTDNLEEELEAVPIQSADFPEFNELPNEN